MLTCLGLATIDAPLLILCRITSVMASAKTIAYAFAVTLVMTAVAVASRATAIW